MLYYITLYVTHDNRFSCPTPILQYIYRPTLRQGCPVLSTIYCMAGPPPFFSTLFICTGVAPPPASVAPMRSESLRSVHPSAGPLRTAVTRLRACVAPQQEGRGTGYRDALHRSSRTADVWRLFGEQKQKQDPCSILTLSGKKCLRSRSVASKGFCVAPFVPTSQSHLRHRRDACLSPDLRKTSS